MSKQVKNALFLNEKPFSTIKSTNDGLIKPESFDITPKYYSSILMRGYVTSYYINIDSKLVLKDLSVNVNMNDDLKFINGIAPHISSKTNITFGTTYRIYKNINMTVEYSGYILVGCNEIKNNYKNSKLHGVNYEEVIELELEKGKVISIKNLSDKYNQHRTKIESKDSQLNISNKIFDDEIKKWRDQNFKYA